MGIRHGGNIKILKRGTGVAGGTSLTPQTSVLEDIYRITAQLNSKGDGYTQDLSVYASTYIPGVSRSQADELHQDLLDYRDGSNFRYAQLGQFLDLFYNKSHSRLDNDSQLNKPINKALLTEAINRGWVVGEKNRSRTSYSLTEMGKRLACLYCTRFYIPFDEKLLPSKHLHPVPEYQRRFFALPKRDRLILGVSNTYGYELSQVAQLDLKQHFEFVDFTPPASRVKPGRFDVQREHLPAYQKLVKMLLESFAVAELNEAKPILLDSAGYKSSRRLVLAARNQQGKDQLLTMDEVQYSYFRKNYGQDIKIYLDPQQLVYQNNRSYRYNNLPVAVIKEGKMVGAVAATIINPVDYPLDTSDISKIDSPRRSPAFPGFINFWRAFGKM